MDPTQNRRLDEIALEHLKALGLRAEIERAIIAYIEYGCGLGHFLTAVFENNLNRAFGHADDENLQHIGALTKWIYNYAPGPCWGSEPKMRAWRSYVHVQAGGMQPLPEGVHHAPVSAEQQCDSQLDQGPDAALRCRLPKGHDGAHSNSGRAWSR